MASVKRRTDRAGNRWQATLHIDGRERTKTFDRKVDAESWVAAQRSARDRGELVDPSAGRATFDEVAKAWLESNPSKRPTTRARDETVIRVHLKPVIGHVQIGRVRPNHIKAVVDGMATKKLNPKTIATNYGVLRAICRWAVDDDLIGRSPCRGIRLPEVRKTSKRVASAKELTKLLQVVHQDYRVMIYLGALGLRLAEVVGLRVGSIDFLRRTLTVEATINEVSGKFVDGAGKTEAAHRTISLPQAVLDELAEHLRRTSRTASDALVVQAPNGGPLRATNFRRRIYDPAIAAVGLDGLTFHRLRHSAGHIMREIGIPLEVIQKRLGHRSIRTTADVYGSLPESVDRAVADSLDRLFTAPNRIAEQNLL